MYNFIWGGINRITPEVWRKYINLMGLNLWQIAVTRERGEKQIRL